MFVEEYGLKRLMKETNTINVEMSIKEFEDGRWASIKNQSMSSLIISKISCFRKQTPLNNHHHSYKFIRIVKHST
ncbi:hypothetical protein KEM48_009035 [Puccinia striiformis f. sp. tritici PST-130]|nr:hypothetical protein KEM48_009035 [Puccinia striiformis f. sp. tritici PST-130]